MVILNCLKFHFTIGPDVLTFQFDPNKNHKDESYPGPRSGPRKPDCGLMKSNEPVVWFPWSVKTFFNQRDSAKADRHLSPSVGKGKMSGERRRPGLLNYNNWKKAHRVNDMLQVFFNQQERSKRETSPDNNGAERKEEKRRRRHDLQVAG